MSRDADDAVDGMDIFSELIDVLGVIHDAKRTGSGEKLERDAGADRGIMDDVKLIAKHWLRLNEDKENQPKPITEADRRRTYRLRKRARAACSHVLLIPPRRAKKPLIGAPCTLLAVITQKKSEELALRVLPEVASARMRAVMVAGAQLFQSKSAIDSRISAREQARDAVSDGAPWRAWLPLPPLVQVHAQVGSAGNGTPWTVDELDELLAKKAMHFAAGNYDAVGAIAIAGRKEDAVRRRLERMMVKMKVDEALAEAYPEYCLKEKAFKQLAKGRAEEAKRAAAATAAAEHFVHMCFHS